ncbi:MAG TPA: hypothetical protein VKD90_17270 [Gemmataceae bacterium]|nr:hypothetical protein [Gemmataceae bacterium]
MNRSNNRLGSEWVALIGVGLGLVVAVILSREFTEGPGDRPVVMAIVTGVVAVLWMVAYRMVVGPAVARVDVPKQKEP